MLSSWDAAAQVTGHGGAQNLEKSAEYRRHAFLSILMASMVKDVVKLERWSNHERSIQHYQRRWRSAKWSNDNQLKRWTVAGQLIADCWKAGSSLFLLGVWFFCRFSRICSGTGSDTKICCRRRRSTGAPFRCFPFSVVELPPSLRWRRTVAFTVCLTMSDHVFNFVFFGQTFRQFHTLMA